MEGKLKLRYNKLLRQAEAIFTSIENLPEETIYQKPDANSWSIAQVIAHLVSVEKVTLGYLVNKKYEEIRNRGNWRNRLNYGMLNLALRSRFKFKVPPVEALKPEDKPELSQHINDWKEVQLNLKKYLEGFPAEAQQRMVFRHPLAGALTIEQCLSFMLQHMQHHLPQLNTLLPKSRQIERIG